MLASHPYSFFISPKESYKFTTDFVELILQKQLEIKNKYLKIKGVVLPDFKMEIRRFQF